MRIERRGSGSARSPGGSRALLAAAAPGAGPGWGMTPLRVFVGVNVALVVLFYLRVTSFQRDMSRLEQAVAQDHQSLQAAASVLARRGGGGAQQVVLAGSTTPPATTQVATTTASAGRSAAETQAQLEAADPRVLRAGTFGLGAGLVPAGHPPDLDDLVAARAAEINLSWVNKPGAHNWWEKPGYHLSFMEPDPPYPFQRVKTEDGKDGGVVALIAPFYYNNYYKGESARALFWHLKRSGHIVIGVASYQEFPRQVSNPHDDRHTTAADWALYHHVDGWLHCFRQPEVMLPPGAPRILLSESDFHNPFRQDSGGSLVPLGLAKKYDVFHSNLGGAWNDYARNWTLAKACIKALIAAENATVLLLGRDLSTAEDADLKPLLDSGHLVSHQKALWKDLLQLIEQSRTLMAPNVYDASPRVVVEALCMDVPVLINRHIVGGWKYATQQTGELFETPDEFVAKWRLLMSAPRRAQLAPRQWFVDNSGYDRASYKLQAFLELIAGTEALRAAKARVVDHNPVLN